MAQYLLNTSDARMAKMKQLAKNAGVSLKVWLEQVIDKAMPEGDIPDEPKEKEVERGFVATDVRTLGRKVGDSGTLYIHQNTLWQVIKSANGNYYTARRLRTVEKPELLFGEGYTDNDVLSTLDRIALLLARVGSVWDKLSVKVRSYFKHEATDTKNERQFLQNITEIMQENGIMTAVQ